MFVIRRLMLAVPIALLWVAITAQVSLGSFGVGLLMGLAMLTVLHYQDMGREHHLTLGRVWALLVYTLILFKDILMSSLDVAGRVIQRDMPLKPGIVAVPTFDNHDAISAMSAHGITITPGQLVVDFESNDILYVHCLDAEQSAQTMEVDQKKRLKYLRKIWGLE